jgi:nicotinamidase-related amidase
MAETGAGWLAVIDMQRVFADPDSPWRAPRFAEIVAPVSRLVSQFGDRVTLTRFIAPGEPAGAWQRYYEQWPFALQPPGARLYELVDELAGRPTLDATTFGKWGPELAARAGTGPLVLAGVSTDCCVLSTALAAADAGMPVQVVADACAGADDDTHARALDIMRLYAPLIEVVGLRDVLGS